MAQARRSAVEYRRAERQAQADYREARAAEVEEANQELESYIDEIDTLLSDVAKRNWSLNFQTLKEPHPPAPDPSVYAAAPAGFFTRIFGIRRAAHDAKVLAAQIAYQAAERAHQANLARVEGQHMEVDAYRERYRSGLSADIVEYFTDVLAQLPIPDGFPEFAKVGWIPESKQLVVELDVPPYSSIPAVTAYRYVKARDAIEPKPRPERERRALYTSVVAQLSLQILHAIFSANDMGFVDTVVVNCHVDAINPATGQPTRPCLLTVRTSSDDFMHLDLTRVEPVECIRSLHADVSRSPAELAPVRPIVHFNMVDERFVASTDVLAGLDDRPNLMELTPGEFEALITNLFEKMGLETRLTRASRDGGVDCVAWDMRPVVGGKVVVQAKRYKNTVGVTAIRDLYGTLLSEGAAKGILVTTSGYGKASFDFAAGKPLELISGGQLLALLEDHAGIRAQIVAPDSWTDPIPDSPNSEQRWEPVPTVRAIGSVSEIEQTVIASDSPESDRL